jgi:hypothetical protein
MKFEKDIFISYAHIDDEPLVESQNGWITEFHRVLAIRLSQLMGRRPVIWRDPELHGNHIFDQQIVDQFSQVAIMISILTPRYTKSDWCVKEANEFYDVCKTNIGFSVNNKARIFKVIKTPLKIEQHPESIRNILGYEFYSSDPTTGRLKEFSQQLGQQTEKLYWDKMDDLANDIAEFLEDLESYDGGNTGVQVNGNGNSQKEGLKIYLAESSFETRELRDNIRRELQDSGYKVFPDTQLPFVELPLIQNVESFLSESQLSVHLVGESYGMVPEGTLKSIVEIQNEVAAAASSSRNLQRLIWVPEGFNPKEERQISFLNKLNEGNEGIEGADLIQSSLESFKEILSDKINFIERENKKNLVAKEAKESKEAKEVEKSDNNAVTINNGSRIIYLISDILDIDEIQPLEDFLFENGCEVVLPIFEGDESLIRSDHIENLKMCDAAIIFYGKANEIWLRSKTRDFLKISGYGRETPLNFKAIYLAGEPSISKERFRSQDSEIINGMNEFPTELLKSLISKL